jgi:hypothetical protein
MTAFQRKTVKIEPNFRAARAWRRRTIKVKKIVRRKDRLIILCIDSIVFSSQSAVAFLYRRRTSRARHHLT